MTTNQPKNREELVELMARAIDPHAFKMWQMMFEHCLLAGDDAETAKRYADKCDGAPVDAARMAAISCLNALASAQLRIVPETATDDQFERMRLSDRIWHQFERARFHKLVRAMLRASPFRE